jgi:hypothetical protein
MSYFYLVKVIVRVFLFSFTLTNFFTKSNRKIVERGKIDTTNTGRHDHSFSRFNIGTSIKNDEIKLVLWSQTSPLTEMMRSCKCCRHVSKDANSHI